QAEDGIRYRNVTGVQTCALPIYTITKINALRQSGSALLYILQLLLVSTFMQEKLYKHLFICINMQRLNFSVCNYNNVLLCILNSVYKIIFISLLVLKYIFMYNSFIDSK